MNNIVKWVVGGTALLFVVWLLAGAPSYAADLNAGGNCCSDLEERIAELEATTARKGNRKVSVKIEGVVNKAALYYDAKDLGDAFGSDTRIIENGADETRVRISGEAQIRPGWAAGFVLELGQGETGVVADLAVPELGINTRNNLYTRQSFVFIGSKDLGTVSIGLQSMATDDLTQQSVALGTTAPSKRLTYAPIGGLFVSVGPIDLLSVPLEPFNGRKADAIRYFSPNWSGFTVSAAWDAGDDSWDAALRYAGSQAGFDIVAAVGYYDDKTNDIVESLSLILPGLEVSSTTLTLNGGIKHTASGIFVQGSWARLDVDLPDAVGPDFDTDSWHVQGGIEAKWTALGPTTVFAEYADWSDLDLSFYGLGVTQSLIDGVEVYALARRYEIDLGEGADIDTIMGGARVRF